MANVGMKSAVVKVVVAGPASVGVEGVIGEEEEEVPDDMVEKE